MLVSHPSGSDLQTVGKEALKREAKDREVDLGASSKEGRTTGMNHGPGRDCRTRKED